MEYRTAFPAKPEPGSVLLGTWLGEIKGSLQVTGKLHFQANPDSCGFYLAE